MRVPRTKESFFALKQLPVRGQSGRSKNSETNSFDFSIDPAYYQTNWFHGSSVPAFLALLWALYRVPLAVTILPLLADRVTPNA
jgi:hypothetical protein